MADNSIVSDPDLKDSYKTEQQIQQFAGLVVSIIKKLHIPHSLYEDCHQCGIIGIINGLKSFDPNKGILSSHIYNHIKWEILRYLKKEYKHKTVELYDNLPQSHIYSRTDIEEYLPVLTELEKTIIDLKLQSYSLKQISEKLNFHNSYYIYTKYQEILKKIRNAQ